VRPGLVVHRALGRGLVVVVVVDGHAEAQRQQRNRQDERGERQRRTDFPDRSVAPRPP
jgi:hypothetical protein